jgi:hypothetical protein
VNQLVRKRRVRGKAAKSLWDLDDLIFFCQSSNGVGTLHVVAFRDTDNVPVMKVISWDTRATGNRLELIASESLPSLCWPETGTLDTSEWREKWTGAFTTGYREGIKSAAALATRMADVAKAVRDEVVALYEIETAEGPLRQLFDEVKKSLRADLTPVGFADMYAQTMVYGLLTARITHPEDFEADALNSVLKFENPFLDALYSSFRRKGDQAFDVDDFGLHDLAEILAKVNMDQVLADFGSNDRKDDPVVFFYEEFLDRYDQEQRKELGTYYTPIPVVRFMVRAVDWLLKSELNLPLGVADQSTWGDYSKQHKIAVPQGLGADDKVVRILDPATGTGTFLLELIRQGERNLRDSNAHSNRAMKTLVEQMDAFEISLSSYAVAHLKCSLELDPHLRSETHLGIRLTDTLAGRAPDQLELFGDDPIAVEAQRAEEIKFDRRHSVVIGNPPYLRTNREMGGGWLVHPTSSDSALFDEYLERALRKTAFGHTRSLFNLYTYFWRFAHWKAFEQNTGPAVVAFITASSWLTGPGFLGIREVARELSDEIYIVDLGGDNLGTRPEENIFPIQIPVAIAFLVRRPGAKQTTTQPARVHYMRIEGTRLEKLERLSSISIETANWINVDVDIHSPMVPGTGDTSWGSWPELARLFPLQQPGCKWARTWPYSTERDVLESRWDLFLSRPTLAWREKAFVTAKTGRKPSTKVGDLPRLADIPSGTPPPPIMRYAFRSFDRQWAFADERISDGYRPSLWASLSDLQIFMTTTITGKLGSGPAATVATAVPDYHYFNGRGGKDIIPLYRNASGEKNSDANLLRILSDVMGVADDCVTHERLFAYCFGVLAGTNYTDRFRLELETPGPRVPLTRDAELFSQMADHGELLLWLQTFGGRFRSKNRRDLRPDSAIRWKRKPTRIPVDSRDFSYDSQSESLTVADGELGGVGSAAWEFEVSGLQVIKKWLGYRTAKGTGRAVSSGSPLDKIRPTEWGTDWSEELRELVHVLTETESIRPRGVALLDSILAGDLVLSEDLPEPPAYLLKPPGAASGEELFD